MAQFSMACEPGVTCLAALAQTTRIGDAWCPYSTGAARMNETERLISEWYIGELQGDAFFCALAEQSNITQVERYKWQLLAALEAATGERLRHALDARGLSIPVPDQTVVKAKRAGEKFAGKPWIEIMSSLKPDLEGYVDSIRVQAAQMPDTEVGIAQDYVAHEEALLEFAVTELSGRDGSVAITRLLCDQWGQEAPTRAA